MRTVSARQRLHAGVGALVADHRDHRRVGGEAERRLPEPAERHLRADDHERDREALAGLGGQAAHLGDRHGVLEQVDRAEAVEHRPAGCRGDVPDRPEPPPHHARDLGARHDVDLARVVHGAQTRARPRS